jgi:hypothetical protein
MPTAWFVAPGISIADLSDPPTFKEKTWVFERSVLGWQLEIADALINGSKAVAGSGYAVLSIVASYPEMIWQFVNGRESKGCSPVAFREGMALIFPNVDLAETRWRDALDLIYDQVRCGLYHDGKARRHVILSHEFAAPIQLSGSPPHIRINPHQLPGAFIFHFQQYISRLRALGEHSQLGQNFVTFFDTHW